jgi:predicted component of type VI protein secretion system
MRDKIGSFMSRGNVESFLNNWIADYVLLDDDAPQAMGVHLILTDFEGYQVGRPSGITPWI